MKKVCLITHSADSDGAFPIILAKLVFDDIEIHSCEVNEVDNIVKKVLEYHNDFEHIYIVDLCISDSLALEIDNNEILNEKITIYDHHESRINLNKYSFINIIVEEKGKKECGTTLFFKYLRDKYNLPILKKKVVLQLIELVRQLDTYDFTDKLKDDAFKLGNLYSIYGREEYINNFYEYILNNDTFSFTNTENTLLKIEEERNNRYINEKLKHVRKAKIRNIPVGIVFAEKNRSALGHAIVENNPDIDIAVVINVDRSVSYRADKDNVDVNEIAKFYNGGGHKHAGGSPIPNNLQEKICKYIFKKIKWLN